MTGAPGIISQAVSSVRPGWFTSVMGTGILALCAGISPIRPRPLELAAIALLALSTGLLVGLAMLLVAQAIRHPARLAATFHNPDEAQAWGAPPMGFLTVAAGFFAVGPAVIGATASIAIAQVLWIVGVAGSLLSVVGVPYLMFTRLTVSREDTDGSWLLPVVPAIVASVPSAWLVPTWPAGWQPTILAGAYAMWGAGIILAAIVIVMYYTRLTYHSVPDASVLPTLWIVIGPIGQSIAGIIALGEASRGVWPQWGQELHAAGLFYGLPVWGFGMYWLAIAITVTIRAARRRLPFNLSWWSFTFPVGVLTAGTYALETATHAAIFLVVGVALLGLLALNWALVAVRTTHDIARAYHDREDARRVAG